MFHVNMDDDSIHIVHWTSILDRVQCLSRLYVRFVDVVLQIYSYLM
jgi:hypothetical protein